MDDDSTRSRTVWCGNLSDKTEEIILYELFLQAGPLEDVHMPKDKDGKKRSYGFITFKHQESVPYAIELLNGIVLYGKPLKLDAREGSKLVDNPYRLALMKHHRSLSNSNSRHNESDHYRSEETAPRISRVQETQQNWPSVNNWSQNGPNARVPPGMARFQPGISFQMTSFMSGTTAFPQINPQLFMFGNNQQGIFPWQMSQDPWFNQRRF